MSDLAQLIDRYGLPVVVLVAIMTGLLWPKHHVEALRKDTLRAAREAGKAAGKELVDHFEGKFFSRKRRAKRIASAIRERRKA